MPREHVEVVLRSLDAWHRSDIDEWLAVAHPEVEWHSDQALRDAGQGEKFVP